VRAIQLVSAEHLVDPFSSIQSSFHFLSVPSNALRPSLVTGKSYEDAGKYDFLTDFPFRMLSEHNAIKMGTKMSVESKQKTWCCRIIY
jgi:hypothetical protein